jgi:hypothetical protein
LPRNIFTNKAVGGLATAIVGLGLAIGAAHQAPATKADTTPAKAEQAAAVVAATAPAAAKPADKPAEAPKQEAAKPAEKPAAPAKPKPVAGLDQTQMDNAKKIVDTAKGMGMPEKAQVIAVATAMQESNLHNLASTKIPESYQYTTEGEGSDYDSVGLFQQRPNWGKVKDLMTPETSTKKFLQALKQVDGWQDMPVTRAAQTVQVSAYPDAYAKHEAKATAIVAAINK